MTWHKRWRMGQFFACWCCPVLISLFNVSSVARHETSLLCVAESLLFVVTLVYYTANRGNIECFSNARRQKISNRMPIKFIEAYWNFLFLWMIFASLLSHRPFGTGPSFNRSILFPEFIYLSRRINWPSLLPSLFMVSLSA